MAADFPQQPKGALWAMQKLAGRQDGRVCTAPLVDTVSSDATRAIIKNPIYALCRYYLTPLVTRKLGYIKARKGQYNSGSKSPTPRLLKRSRGKAYRMPTTSTNFVPLHNTKTEVIGH